MSKQIFIKKSKNIKLIATDIDGVWTDAKMYYTEDGEYMKLFSTYDGMATALLKNQKIVWDSKDLPLSKEDDI